MGGMDERSRLRALVDACQRVMRQLEMIGADENNPFAERIRETCRELEARLKKLESRPR